MYEITMASLFSEPEYQGPQKPQAQNPPVDTTSVYEKQMFARKKRLLFDKIIYDVVFDVQGEEVHAHKAILAMASDYFLNMFNSGMQEAQNSRIKVANIEPKTFKAIIEYIYLDILPKEDGLIQQLLMLSDEYLLQKLKDECEDYFVKNVKQDKMIELFLIADMVEANKLKKKCMELIITKIPPVKICENKDLIELPKNLILELLQHSLSAY